MINRLVVFLVIGQFAGCMLWRVPTMADQQRALELVDRGVVDLRQGEFVRAETAFQLAQELYNLPAASDGLGCVAFLRGEDQEAERYFRQALEIDYSYTEAYGNLALLFERKGDLEQAEAYYQRALELSPANYRVRNNYAIFLKQHLRSESPQSKAHLLKAALLSAAPLVEANINELSK